MRILPFSKVVRGPYLATPSLSGLEEEYISPDLSCETERGTSIEGRVRFLYGEPVRSFYTPAWSEISHAERGVSRRRYRQQAAGPPQGR